MLLREAKNIGDLYHFTSAKNAIAIMDDNKLGKILPDKSWDFFSKKKTQKPIISFTRNKNFYKAYRAIGAPLHSYFIVDGKKLSQNYKIKPHHDKTALFSPYKEDSEAEERVEKLIPNFITKYVKTLVIIKANFEDEAWADNVAMWEPDSEWGNKDPKDLINILKNKAKSKGIKVRII